MAVQKRRQSSARRDSRRAQWMKMATPAASNCPNCGAAKMPHRICDACGWYGPAKEGRVVIPKPTENEAPAEKA
ncbi:MAG: 50S ribosomal protein L32 [Polyangia bacterium]